MSTAIATRPANNTLATYDRVTDPIAFSEHLSKSLELLCGAPVGSGTAIGMLMLCEGLTVMEVAQRYHFIQGRPSKRSDAMLAEFRMNWGGDYEVVERSPNRAAIKFTDSRGRVYEREFTLAQLNESRWPWKDWQNHEKGYKDNYGTPKDRETMMFARLVSDSLRFICPELVAGVYTPEEMEDLAPAAAVTAIKATPTIDERIAAAKAAPVEDVIVDASFTVATDPAPAAAEHDPAAPGSIHGRQAERVDQLFTILGMTPEQRESALAKRKASVVRNLSANDAQELIDRLEAKARELNLVGAPAGE
jgi:hypothetical protein